MPLITDYDDVSVRPSTLPGAGYGLFAERDWEIGENVVPLPATYMTRQEFDALDPSRGDYIIEINTVRPSRFVDLRGEPAGFANTLSKADRARDRTLRFNVRFFWDRKRRMGFLRTRTRVQSGEEFFVDYGSHFELIPLPPCSTDTNTTLPDPPSEPPTEASTSLLSDSTLTHSFVAMTFTNVAHYYIYPWMATLVSITTLWVAYLLSSSGSAIAMRWYMYFRILLAVGQLIIHPFMSCFRFRGKPLTGCPAVQTALSKPAITPQVDYCTAAIVGALVLSAVHTFLYSSLKVISGQVIPIHIGGLVVLDSALFLLMELVSFIAWALVVILRSDLGSAAFYVLPSKRAK